MEEVVRPAPADFLLPVPDACIGLKPPLSHVRDEPVRFPPGVNFLTWGLLLLSLLRNVIPS
eukprot:10444644-Heterocapsa_arctica.AAC.1